MENTKIFCENDGQDYFSCLPYELLLHIVSYLDFRTLVICGRVNKTWYTVTKDPYIFRTLNLQRLPNISDDVLRSLFRYSKIIKGLDISWAFKLHISEDVLAMFIKACKNNLTYLSCEVCLFKSDYTMKQIGNLRHLRIFRMRNCDVLSGNFHPLGNFNKLITLSIHKTNINDKQFILILKQNPNLKHIFVSLCRRMRSLDNVIKAVVEYNKELITWSSNEMRSVTDDGLQALSECHNLEDLDLSWCQKGFCNVGPLFEKIAMNCPKLYRLMLVGWRDVTDKALMPFVIHCKQLKYLDFERVQGIRGPICDYALNSLTNIKSLIISECRHIDDSQVEKWRKEFPHVNIIRGLSYI